MTNKLINIIRALKGGTGSGNFGHSGRPGKIGGSSGGGKGGGGYESTPYVTTGTPYQDRKGSNPVGPYGSPPKKMSKAQAADYGFAQEIHGKLPQELRDRYDPSPTGVFPKVANERIQGTDLGSTREMAGALQSAGFKPTDRVQKSDSHRVWLNRYGRKAVIGKDSQGNATISYTVFPTVTEPVGKGYHDTEYGLKKKR